MSIVNLQNDPIFVRSPYIIEIDEPGQIEGRVDIWLWNRLDPPPVTPTYTTAKKIPGANISKLSFNISHYVRENIEFIDDSDLVFNVAFNEIPQNEWTFAKVRRYVKYNGDVDFTELDTKTYIALDGYGYYEEGLNPILSNILLKEGVYDYYFDPNNVPGPTHDYNYRYGDIKIVLPDEDYKLRYTDLVTGSTFEVAVVQPNLYVVQTYLVYPLYAENGNLVEYLDDLGGVIWSATMKPIEECKYTVNALDFVNGYGVWQRTFAFKASRKSIQVTTEQHDLFKRDLVPYNPFGPENKLFNVNARKTVKLNTGWVYNDTYNDLVLEPLMLSERVQLNQYPVIMKTRNTELFENINQHMINYELSFEYAYDVINNVV